MIIYTLSGRPLLLDGGDIFTGVGTHVARLQGNVAYDPLGRYVGTIEGEQLVFRDEDCLSSGPLFLRTGNAGFVHIRNIPWMTNDREILLSE